MGGSSNASSSARPAGDIRPPRVGARPARLPGGILRPTGIHTLSGCGVSGKREFPRGLWSAESCVVALHLSLGIGGGGRVGGLKPDGIRSTVYNSSPPSSCFPQREEARGRPSSQRGGKGQALESHLPPSRAAPMCDTPGFPPEGRALEFARRGLQELRLEAMVCGPKSAMV